MCHGYSTAVGRMIEIGGEAARGRDSRIFRPAVAMCIGRWFGTLIYSENAPGIYFDDRGSFRACSQANYVLTVKWNQVPKSTHFCNRNLANAYTHVRSGAKSLCMLPE